MVKALNYGRMGNVLFQNACAIALAFRNGMEFTVPSETRDAYWNPLYLQHLVNPKWETYKQAVLINEHQHNYKPIEIKDEWHDLNIVLNGYWQSVKYFEDYFDEVLTLFNFKWYPIDKVALHIRRGDYAHLLNKHPPVSDEFYRDAMAMFPNKVFKIFSDDIPYCKNKFGNADNIEYSTNTNEVDDIVEMSCCENQIMSSSTFSLWGYFLNKNKSKIGVMPKLWFVEGYDLDTSDIVPPEIIRL
jgi:hypothetical protein